MRTWLRRSLLAVGLLLAGTAAATDVPVSGLKLIVVDKTALAAGAKAVFVVKDAAVTKGAGVDPGDIEGLLDVAYDDRHGSFALPAGGGWLVNKASVAKYVNKAAPAGGAVKVGVVKPGALLKVVAKSLGEPQLDVGAAPSGPVDAAFAVTNGGETYRHCTRFTACVHKAIAGGAGSKLVCKGTGTPDPACNAVAQPTCGDGEATGGETCDPPGTACGPGGSLLCDDACNCHLCGNGTTEPGEQCDDGDLEPGDGCDAACLDEESAAGSITPGGEVTSDGENDGATAADPVETSIVSPVAGSVTLLETSPSATPPAGIELIGRQAEITAPAASVAAPLVLTFLLDASVVRPDAGAAGIGVFRNGTEVESCAGAPGSAFPDPCVAQRTALADGDAALEVLTSAASTWTFGLPLCGNGTVDAGEQCDPQAPPTCAAGSECKSTCECLAACDCCAAAAPFLRFQSDTAAGQCGSVRDAGSTELLPLERGLLYLGGGYDSIPPAAFVNDTTLIVGVTGCDAATERLTLGPATAAATGDARVCSAAGCPFGPPMPLQNGAVSLCYVHAFAQDVSGTATCDGDVDLTVPLVTQVWVTGNGVQACPACTGPAGGETCQWGPAAGASCTPVGDGASPPSHDCPPDGSLLSLPLGGTLRTGTSSATADAMGRFCVGDAASTQMFTGAFGFTAATQVTIAGEAAGCIADGTPKAATLAGGWCIPRSGNILIDGAIDLPGPAAMSLSGTMALAASTTSTTMSTTTTSTTTSTVPPPCDCCTSGPQTLEFTTSLPAGACGSVTDDADDELVSLACGGLYFGGGTATIPMPTPFASGSLVMGVTSCNGGTEALTLGALPAATTGSQRNCSEAGCLFGPPIPVINGGLSFCHLHTLAQDAAGTATCGGGASIHLPLASEIVITGNSVDPCPRCVGVAGSETCSSGLNIGGACTPAATVFYPTSHDCPAVPAVSLPAASLDITLSTGATALLASDTGSQPRVFCGHCQDAGQAPCVTDADCTPPATCRQAGEGAFGEELAAGIAVDGAAAGCLAAPGPHPATLAGVACVPATSNTALNNSGSLPGPAALSLVGTMTLE